ncbi:MAG: hypothetical protein JWM11_4760 [Planctomycetaceae bacterium]|nr:hypothetical protein [Planctomycetaceae bacterium]
MASRYTTVTLIIRRTAAHRERLGADFCRLVSLAIRFSTVRAILQWRDSARLEPGEWGVRAQELHSAFMAGTLSPDFPSLAEENEVVSRAIEEVQQEQMREWTRRTKGLGAEEVPVQED